MQNRNEPQSDLSKKSTGLPRTSGYTKMSNNVPDKIKPFGTLRDFGAGHLGHYETFLYGHRLGSFGTLQDFVENFSSGALTPPP